MKAYRRTWGHEQDGLPSVHAEALNLNLTDTCLQKIRTKQRTCGHLDQYTTSAFHATQITTQTFTAADVLRKYTQIERTLVSIDVVLKVAFVEATARHLHGEINARSRQHHGVQQEAADDLDGSGALEV